MKKIFFLLCMSILAAPLLLAADQKAAPVAPKNKPTEKASPMPAPVDPKNNPTPDSASAPDAAPIALKNKSSFNVDGATRSPFWPISWKPAAKIASGGNAQGEVPPGAFLVTSITLDGATKFAIINGKTMGEGQQFGLQVGTQIYQVMVKQIDDGRVIIGRGDDEIVVPLRRKEASGRAPDGATRSPTLTPNH